tara:strand:- start:633 stop:1316 length:684 start_codon:yes stop_codon:yes gene_type:complete
MYTKLLLIGIILTSVLYFLAEYNPISMEVIINQHGYIKDYITSYPILSILISILLIVVMISLMGPITPLCILAGFYFGLHIGLVISIIGEVIGALIVFLYGRYLFKAYILKQFGQRFDRFKDGFNRNSISYLLFIRVIGGTPFGIQNLLPAVLDMRLRDYFIATFFGVIPWAYILVSVGNGIQNIMDTQEFSSNEILKLEYVLPIILISIIVIIPVIYKFIKKRFLV